MSKEKLIYFFGGKHTEGGADDRQLLGGKGANLAEMASIGIPVPPGFTVSTEACKKYYEVGKQEVMDKVKAEVRDHLSKVEELTGKTFGKGSDPLLLSVRSGAAMSMPGMMDTVLNLGLNNETIKAMVEKTGNERFVLDSYRRLIQMFGDVVMGIEDVDEGGNKFDPMHKAMDEVKERHGCDLDTDLDTGQMQEVVDACLETYKKYTGEEFPQDPMDQLMRGISAVFESWNTPRAVRYREIHEIRGLLGTAVNIQTMVFGNMGDDSCSGVAFTRDPATGANELYGEYLTNAQGEDVVAGIRTPLSLETLKEQMPENYKKLNEIRKKLEQHYKDMQDTEFTIEQGTLYMLQTRRGERTGMAAVEIAMDMLDEGLLTEKEAVLRIPASDLDQLLHPRFDEKEEKKVEKLATGLPASPGAATGKIVFDADRAEQQHAKGDQVILCRLETSPDDIGGMHAAEGILTSRGGMTSHAAVVARGWGKCCVAGAGDIVMDYTKREFQTNGKTFKEGDWISINGTTGAVYEGKIPTVEPKMTGSFARVMELADKYRKLKVRTNSDTPKETESAIKFGAEGIGLTRTEHMFFEGDRIISFRRLILVAERVKTINEKILDAADDEAKVEQIKKENKQVLGQFQQALDELLPLQRQDFEDIFRTLKGRPCTIRLLDPPLNEFLPHEEAGQKRMAESLNVSLEDVKKTVESLDELNPMLGHRGCRLGLTYPDVSEMQIRAIIEAAVNIKKNEGIDVEPEIMVPLVGKKEELSLARKQAEEVITEIFDNHGVTREDIPYKIGTMIEVPMAAVTADQIAECAEFFSFGTNDLTQMGYGFSRDDAGKFLRSYMRMGIFEHDPFQTLDQGGIGRLMDTGVSLGRKTNPELKIGICGEHGGDPESVKFCHRLGLDYVSCSPFRVPIARLAAAQAAVEELDGREKVRTNGETADLRSVT